jgi:hypothetical protein
MRKVLPNWESPERGVPAMPPNMNLVMSRREAVLPRVSSTHVIELSTCCGGRGWEGRGAWEERRDVRDERYVWLRCSQVAWMAHLEDGGAGARDDELLVDGEGLDTCGGGSRCGMGEERRCEERRGEVRWGEERRCEERRREERRWDGAARWHLEEGVGVRWEEMRRGEVRWCGEMAPGRGSRCAMRGDEAWWGEMVRRDGTWKRE